MIEKAARREYEARIRYENAGMANTPLDPVKAAAQSVDYRRLEAEHMRAMQALRMAQMGHQDYETLLHRWKASQEALRACLTGLTALRGVMVPKEEDGAQEGV